MPKVVAFGFGADAAESGDEADSDGHKATMEKPPTVESDGQTEMKPVNVLESLRKYPFSVLQDPVTVL
jgi:hypothetical protein